MSGCTLEHEGSATVKNDSCVDNRLDTHAWLR